MPMSAHKRILRRIHESPELLGIYQSELANYGQAAHEMRHPSREDTLPTKQDMTCWQSQGNWEYEWNEHGFTGRYRATTHLFGPGPIYEPNQ